ncbi:hypothetical protein OB919_20640 [Halobacteria archaeon AArc-curdl1]|uniref:DUF7511 domain-containing protein n=1 Tax=Natronosalvus hydrolyticus TaxID=2979988 RepID=A0AAP2ZBT3_9EURY|nr:hypothetical protein [Halobacteria archaeon AArc-curdl1]
MDRKKSDSPIESWQRNQGRIERHSLSTLERPGLECRAFVERMETGVDLCTIYSVASDEMLVSEWISATEDSFCTLEDAR